VLKISGFGFEIGLTSVMMTKIFGPNGMSQSKIDGSGNKEEAAGSP